MTKEDAVKLLERGEVLYYHVWTWSATYKSCSEGCCDDGFTDFESTLDDIEATVGGEWDYLKVLP